MEENHLLYVRLCLNIGILYEDDRQFQEAYDYFIRWDKACMEVIVSFILYSSLLKLPKHAWR